MDPQDEVSRTVEIAASPAAVWEIVSDLPGRAALSTENTGGAWRDGAAGPVVGARFRGTNSNGRRRWSTDATVVRCEPGRSLAISVTAAGLPVSEWSYELVPTPTGCALTETYADRRGRLMKRLGAVVSGVSDRTAANTANIEHSLAALKAAAER